MNALDTAIAYLHAIPYDGDDYAYWDDAACDWYVTDPASLEDLGRRLLAGEPDAYSFWCAETQPGLTVDHLQHDLLDRIVDVVGSGHPVRYQCQCGEATGSACKWTGDRYDLVHVRWVPDADRGSAEASGTYTDGAYARSLHVTEECAEMLRYIYEDGEPTEREDPFVQVVGPAYR